jgi:hypothetical protein
MPNIPLTLGTIAPEEVFTTLTKKGLTASEAASFVGQWILVTAGKTHRVFGYKQPFPEGVGECVALFARTFVHQDWVDGESVVQASETPGELGFNERFHRIEADLDALSRDVAKSFTCLADMRTALKNILEEIRVEVNRINADIHECCHKGGGGGAVVAPGLVDMGQFIGKVKVQDRMMQLWNTGAGMMMLPDVETLESVPWLNPRAQRAAKLARFVEDDPRVRQTFPAAVTKKQLVTAFGNERLADGTLVRELVALLPDTGRFGSLDALATDLLERESAALRTTEGAAQSVASALGLGADSRDLGSVPVDRLGALPPAARQALLRAGVDTIEKFATMPTAEAHTLLTREGVQVGLGEVAEAATIAKTILKLR